MLKNNKSPKSNNTDFSLKYFGLLGFVNAASISGAVAEGFAGNWGLTAVFSAFAVVGGVAMERYADKESGRLKAHFNGFATGAVINLAVAVAWPQLSVEEINQQARAAIKQEILLEQQRQDALEDQLFNDLRNLISEKGIRFNNQYDPD